MKRLFLFLFLAAAGTTYAQDYKTAIGLRLGDPFGVTVKHFFKERTAFEGIIAPRFGGFELVALAEFYAGKPAFGVDRLHFYYGVGGHFGAYGGGRRDPFGRSGNYFTLGADGIVGLEYNIKAAPINFSVDIKPALVFIPGPHFYWDPAFSIRYYFGQ